MSDGYTKYGPTLVMRYRCGDCVWLKNQKYAIADGNDYDWGYEYTCTSIELDAPRHIDSPENTPEWCPYRAQGTNP